MSEAIIVTTQVFGKMLPIGLHVVTGAFHGAFCKVPPVCSQNVLGFCCCCCCCFFDEDRVKLYMCKTSRKKQQKNHLVNVGSPRVRRYIPRCTCLRTMPNKCVHPYFRTIRCSIFGRFAQSNFSFFLFFFNRILFYGTSGGIVGFRNGA